jgi:perosamine synthetase
MDKNEIMENLQSVKEVDLYLDDNELQAIAGCIQKRWLTEGPNTQSLREAIMAETKSPFVTFAPNGTLGLFLALLALDLPKDSEIIIPSFTFYASATAAIFAGLKPVFADVKIDTYNLDPEEFRKKITNKTRAVMVVHCYGQSSELDAILQIAKEYDLRVIEDAAQGFGVRYKNQHVGTFGEVGMISFFSDKVVTMGEGAALLIRDEQLFERIKLMRNQGRPSAGTFIHPELGMNFRITDLHAAIGLSQIKKFPEIRARRLALWNHYREALQDVGDIQFMTVIQESNLTPFRFPLTTKYNVDLQQYLQKNGIGTRGFFYPMHLQPKLRTDPVAELPNSETLFNTGLCLPVHKHIRDQDVQYIVETIKLFYQSE